MRHHLSGRQLSRNSAHRHALLRSLAAALLRFESIRTTVPKAKELRRVVEPIITLAKTDSLAARRRAFSHLRDEALVAKLFADIGPRFKTRAGGYTRILKLEPRPGDAADMALMELVDKAQARETMAAPPAEPPAPEKKKRTRKKKVEAKSEAKAEEKPKAKPKRKRKAA